MKIVPNKKENAWRDISQQSNQLKYLEQITGAMIRHPGITGDDVDDIQLLKHSSNIRDLYASVSEDMQERFFSGTEKEEDIAFLNQSISSLVGHIVKEAWETSKGDYLVSKMLCDNALHLMESLLEHLPSINANQAFISLPDKLEAEFVASTLLTPCIRTLIKIQGLDEDNRTIVLAGRKIEELSKLIVKDIVTSTESYIESLLESANLKIDSLSLQQKNITYARARSSIKDAYGNMFDSDFNRMMLSGEFKDIYKQVQHTAEFFFPIIYSDKASLKIENNDVLEKEKVSAQLLEHCQSHIESSKSMPLVFIYMDNGERKMIPFQEFDQWLSPEDFTRLNSDINDDLESKEPVEEQNTQAKNEVKKPPKISKNAFDLFKNPSKNKNNIEVKATVVEDLGNKEKKRTDSKKKTSLNPKPQKIDVSIFSNFGKNDGPKRQIEPS